MRAAVGPLPPRTRGRTLKPRSRSARANSMLCASLSSTTIAYPCSACGMPEEAQADDSNAVTPRRHALLNNPSRPHPPRHPPGALRVTGLEARQLDAGTRAMNERLIADVHPDVRHATTRLRGEQQNVPGPQRLDDRGDLRSGARLIA